MRISINVGDKEEGEKDLVRKGRTGVRREGMGKV